MFRTISIVLISALVALISIQWAALPTYPEGIENKFKRYTIDFLGHGATHIGNALEYIGLVGSERVFRAFYIIGGATMNTISEKDVAPNILIEPGKIESTAVIFYRPKSNSKKSNPTIIYFHGGGWIFGSPKLHSTFTAWLSENTDHLVISVDYGLSPEVTYENQIEECVGLTMKILASPQDYGVDSDKIIIAGDSAGGNLAASVALILSNAEHKLRAVMLLSPALQAANLTLPSYRSYRHYFHTDVEYHIAKRAGVKFDASLQFALNRGLHIPSDTLEKWNRDYFNVLAIPGYEFPKHSGNVSIQKPSNYAVDAKVLKRVTKMSVDSNAFTLVASDAALEVFPTTFIQACEYDFLRDDSLLFAHRLRKVKVPVTLSYLKEAFHVEPIMNFFLPQPMSPAARTGLDDIANFVKSLK